METGGDFPNHAESGLRSARFVAAQMDKCSSRLMSPAWAKWRWLIPSRIHMLYV
jgi:hypothetical protein